MHPNARHTCVETRIHRTYTRATFRLQDYVLSHICMRTCMCTRACTYTNTHTCSYILMHTPTHSYAYTTHTCTPFTLVPHTLSHAPMCTHTSTCFQSTHMSVYSHTRTHVHTHMYVHTPPHGARRASTSYSHNTAAGVPGWIGNQTGYYCSDNVAYQASRLPECPQ